MLETSPAQRYDQVFVDFNSQANMAGATDVFATIANKATAISGTNTDTSYNLVGEEGNTLIPVPTIPPQEFPCGPSTPCLNGGNCVFSPGGSASNYICQCQSCYTGQRCEIDNSGCANLACQNGGQCTPFPNSCSQAYCSCPACFYGRFCENRINACSNHQCQNGAMCVSPQGTCRDYQCLCSGCFTGSFCDNTLPNPCNLNPCQNGGICSPGTNCYSYQCQCANGFSGANCDIARTTNLNLCNNFPCLNGGSCVSSHSGLYVCICRSGWAGQDCGIETGTQGIVSACLSRPCQNGATCYESGSSANQGFSEYACMCTTGFSGPSCSQLTNFAPNLDVCGSNPVSCQNGGVCYNAFLAFDQRTTSVCSCPVGYIGQSCEIQSFDPCSSTPCLSNGVCTSFNSYFTCRCQAGFQGITCGETVIPTNPCLSSPCVSGTCFQGVIGTYFCQCNSGYSGMNCNIPVADPCTSNPCQNNGICTSTTNAFTCQCQQGFIGPTCTEQDIDLIPPNINGCPSNINQIATIGQSQTRVSWNVPMAADPSEIRSMDQLYRGITSFIVDIGGATKLWYSFTDFSDNTAVCAFVVSASSPSGPSINGCPGNMKYEIVTGQQSISAFWTAPTSTPGIPVISTHQPGSQFERGSNLVTYTFGSGVNRAVCAFLIEVRDAIDVCATRNPCQNGGQCVGTGRNYQCLCLAGFTGVHCGGIQFCNSRPCLNGGTCSSSGSRYFCQCLPNYSGDNCQIPSVIGSCNPSPCVNGGTCSSLSTGSGYSCTCPPGFTGVNCQVSSPSACNSSPCQNGGTCIPFTSGSGYFCTCPFGVTGANCQTTGGPAPAPVRLVGGSNLNEGRVEVFYNNAWGTVCDDSWGDTDASVVCRQLGLPSSGAQAAGFAQFGQGTGQIWLDDVLCSGSENRLDECSHNGWGNHNCGHSEDAGVICIIGPVPVRLVGGSNSNEGRVEIFYNNAWGTVCDDSWDNTDATVVCRQLGLPSSGAQAARLAQFGQGTGQIWLDNVLCSGSKNRLDECSHNGWGNHNCGHREDAGVICIIVRLVGGSNSNEGRVEIFYNNAWGTVCDDSWGDTDASVVCRQLGLPSSRAQAASFAQFGQGTGQIWLDNVLCSGSDNRLDECSHNGWGNHNCGHSEDAGVICIIDPCASSPCLNNGQCSSSGSSFSCRCINGYSGNTCQFPSTTDPCSNTPCLNNGRCSFLGSSFSCACINGYSGNTCQIPPTTGGPIQITSCPSGESSTAPTINSRATVFWTMPSAASSGVPLSPVSTFGGATSRSIQPGSAFIIEYLFRDSFGNQATCAFPISASVASGPQISSCPSNNIEVDAQPIGSTSVAWQEPSSSGPLSSQNIPSGSTFYVGNTLVYYVFGDPNFNPSVCAFVVTVRNSPAVGRKKRDSRFCMYSRCYFLFSCFLLFIKYDHNKSFSRLENDKQTRIASINGV
ncbi:uncharacterized protein [Amphiura filiformis]|uniref:uncharacterized protein n=1 Tax=Amphiura filiformis TaxID=82378 RepID=UPI003B20DDF1